MRKLRLAVISAILALSVTTMLGHRTLAATHKAEIYNFSGNAFSHCTPYNGGFQSYNVEVTANWGVANVTWTFNGIPMTPHVSSSNPDVGYLTVTQGTTYTVVVTGGSPPAHQATYRLTGIYCGEVPPPPTPPNGGGGPMSSRYTCVEQVSTKSIPASGTGTESLGRQFVAGGFSLHGTACASLTRSAFAANAAWSNATKLCARVGTIGVVRKHIVWATYYLIPPGNGGGVWLVGGYSVICNGKTALAPVPVPAGPTHESSTL